MSQNFSRIAASALLVCLLPASPVPAIEVVVDYTYDTNGFFDPSDADGQLARSALEAAALRYSNVISSQLAEASIRDNNDDARIGFTHPGTGDYFQISGANSASSDNVAIVTGAAADEYTGGLSFAEDEWRLFAGGRPLASAGIGGTGTGTNFTNIYSESDSHLNRELRESGSIRNLPLWGGVVAFDSSGASDWHYDHITAPPVGKLDLYSIALHEIGHALGLSSTWEEWSRYQQGSTFIGPEVVATYNAENDTQVSSLDLRSSQDGHWQEGVYQSAIFANGAPNLAGTVGLDVMQDLLMEPIANFTANIRRLELTNLDVASLKDIGWTIDESPPIPCDLNGDRVCDISDLDSLIQSIGTGESTLMDRDVWLADAATHQDKPEPFLLGDTNLDGYVNAADLNAIGQNWDQPTGYWSLGDFDGSGTTDAADLNYAGINWQRTNNASEMAAVPEPNAGMLFVWAFLTLAFRRKK